MYELQFPLLLDTMIANTEFESDGSGTNSPGPEKKRKGGLGKGGAAAKYCTMSVAAVLGVVAHSKKLKFCIDVNFLSITFPPQPGDTRWGSWQDASDWFVSMWKPWCSFVHAEAVRNPWKGEADVRPILHLIDEVMQKRPSGTLIRLSFVTDHTTCLMKCLNFAQGEGPTACYMYDKLMGVVQDWKDTLQQAKLSPRIEDSLKVLKNGDNLRTRLLSIVQEMATALDGRLVKEGLQLEFFRQVRVLNPANLPDMSKSLADYPLLGLEIGRIISWQGFVFKEGGEIFPQRNLGVLAV